MSDWNFTHNRAVWFDIPVAYLDRATAFYRAALAIKVYRNDFNGMSSSVLDHADGNGGCLIPRAEGISSKSGILFYMNIDRRIRAAVAEVDEHGGNVIEPVHAIGPHGFRAIVLDCEGNRIALHSTTDA